jgi:acyl-CoA synthetase (AMP-forming)/AMP-acid ligase II
MTRPHDRSANLVDILTERAEQSGASLAYRFLLDGESDEKLLTYAGLAEQAGRVASILSDAGCGRQRAMLVYQPGLEYIVGFLGCLMAGVTAVPAYPPDPFRMERTFPRFQAIVNDSQPAAILSTTAILDLAGDLLDEFPEFTGITRFATDALPANAAAAWPRPDITGDTLAFLQYTSGSTAEPKGVMLTHRNLMANLAQIVHGFRVTRDSHVVIWLPPYHDMGLIGGILTPLYLGMSCTLMSPLDFLQRPMRWLNAMSKYGATVSGGPNFAYDLVARKATPQQKATLDLSRWELAFNGAEPVRKETIERFAAAFAECGFRKEAFYPCYGLAESTLIVSGGTVNTLPRYTTVNSSELGQGRAVAVDEGSQDAQTLVGCGATLLDQVITIVDPETQEPCPLGIVGEIWVSGRNVAQGYWQKPEESERTFCARLAGTEPGVDAPKYLRTGDLGFLDEHGNLFVAGRIKDLIIVDGRNHYPQDIESSVEKSHPAIRPGCTAAFPITDGGQERLVVVAEIGKGYKAAQGAPRPTGDGGPLDPTEVVATIRKAVAEGHDLRAHAIVLLKAGAAPKTSSGKIQRRAARAGYLDGTLETWGA